MQAKSNSEKLFFNTVRVETVSAKGELGSGTGFFFDHRLGDQVYPFIVTNKHVVNEVNKWKFSFIKQKNGGPTLGSILDIEIESRCWPNAWFGHPNQHIDITICPLLPIISHTKQRYGTDLFRATGFTHLTG